MFCHDKYYATILELKCNMKSYISIKRLMKEIENSKMNNIDYYILYAQNFYLLKIHLNLFEISNRVLKFKSLIKN